MNTREAVSSQMMETNSILPMKTIVSVLAAAAVLGFAAPSTAKADFPGQTRIVGYTSYGSPIVSVFQVVGYDNFGNPIYQWVTQGAQYGCNTPRPVYVQPGINLSFGIGGGSCNSGYRSYNPGYGYGYGHHHHGFHR